MDLKNSKSVEIYCFEKRAGFKTYEIPSLKVVYQEPDVLDFQVNNFLFAYVKQLEY